MKEPPVCDGKIASLGHQNMDFKFHGSPHIGDILGVTVWKCTFSHRQQIYRTRYRRFGGEHILNQGQELEKIIQNQDKGESKWPPDHIKTEKNKNKKANYLVSKTGTQDLKKAKLASSLMCSEIFLAIRMVSAN